MDDTARRLLLICLICSALLPLWMVGCNSPYRADQGALLGGAGGAGVGALVGSTVGKAGPGAAIGAGVGALSGAVVGSELDKIEAQNRAQIEQQLGRQIAAGAVRVDDVIQMTRAGVHEELISNHVRAHGMAAPLQTSDLILLQQQGVSPRVIATMQASPPVQAAPAGVVYPGGPAPVIVEEYHYGPPRCGFYYRYPPPRPAVRWGVSVTN